MMFLAEEPSRADAAVEAQLFGRDPLAEVGEHHAEEVAPHSSASRWMITGTRAAPLVTGARSFFCLAIL